MEMEQPLRGVVSQPSVDGGSAGLRKRGKSAASKFHNAVAVNRSGKKTNETGTESKKLRKPGKHAKTVVFQTMSSRSKTTAAQVYRAAMLVLILVNVVAFIASTNPTLKSNFSTGFDVIEAVTSSLFLIDYVLRIATITENRLYKAKGPVCGRLSWAFSAAGLLDALSTFPYFLDIIVLHNVLPSFTWIRIFRIFLLFRTSKYAHAMNTVTRVLWVNAEILGVSLFLVVFMVLFTSALLWATATPEERTTNGFDDIPSAMYLAVLMLTGQGTPDGNLTIISKLVVVLTAFLSVPFFAVPASMLTWGFEGEAERLAQQARKRHARVKLYGAQFEDSISSSSSEGEGSDLEDYLDLVGGAEDDGADELEERALAFFENAVAEAPLLPAARKLAEELEATKLKAQMQQQLKSDALTLLGQVASGPHGTHEEKEEWQQEHERRLQHFRARVSEVQAGASADDPSGNEEPVADSSQPSDGSLAVLSELRALRADILQLSRRQDARDAQTRPVPPVIGSTDYR